MQNRLDCRKKLGFSLVELLVAISIIAVLSAVLMANFMGARERARDAQKIQDLNAIRNGLRMYYNDNQLYPEDDDGNVCTDCLDTLTAYVSAIADIGYSYDQVSDGDGFKLWSSLEAGAGDEDIDSQSKCGVSVEDIKDKIFMVCAN
jgi:prepilin-type N-terminal cleavage/methylation domain-containing protein